MVSSPFGAIPEGWRMGEVAELCARIQAGGTPRRSEPLFWEEGNVPWYKTGDLRDTVLIDSPEMITERALEVSSARSFGPETILMAIYGSPTVGRLGLVQTLSSANQAALGLVADPTKSNTEHLWFVLKELRGYFNRIAQGAAQQNISKAKVERSPVIIPPIELINDFRCSGGIPFRLAHRLMRSLRSTEQMRDLLLPKLVTGQIDVSELDLDALVGSVP